MNKNILAGCLLFFTASVLTLFSGGCAQIGMPTGGPKDTTAPLMVKANPANEQLNFTGNKITFTFDEYIELQDVQANLLVAPFPKVMPSVNSNLKTVTVKLKDTLKPNTTYSIDFGNAIKDVNEGNVYKDFVYTFSTGAYIDSLELSGKMMLAESGKTDSTLLALLYRDSPDSAVTKRKPDYISRIKGDGSFLFTHLPSGNFKLYALKDGDGNKYYNSKTELFAFHTDDITLPATSKPMTIYAYAEEKPAENKTTTAEKKQAEKKLRYSTNLAGMRQDLLSPFEISFNTPIRKFDTAAIYLTDTSFNKISGVKLTFDSTRKILTVNTRWKPEMPLNFILPQEAIDDSVGNTLAKSDTIRFYVKSTTEYGSVTLRFKNLDISRKPVLLFTDGTNIRSSHPLTGSEWTNKLFPPGEYEIRILYDGNGNGKWDPGHYADKLQPEKVISFTQKLTVKADWENERDINIGD